MPLTFKFHYKLDWAEVYINEMRPKINSWMVAFEDQKRQIKGGQCFTNKKKKRRTVEQHTFCRLLQLLETLFPKIYKVIVGKTFFNARLKHISRSICLPKSH